MGHLGIFAMSGNKPSLSYQIDPSNDRSADEKLSARRYYGWLFLFSCAANVLLLAVPIYLSQVYDRVLPSQSFETLLFLTLIIVGALLVFGQMETIRSKIAQKFSAHYVLTMSKPLMEALSVPAASGSQIQNSAIQNAMRDVQTVRQTIAGRSFVNIFDLPFAPLFLAVLFLAHPWLGIFGLTGCLTLIGIAVANDIMSRRPQHNARAADHESRQIIADVTHRTEDLHAMGLGRHLMQKWYGTEIEALSRADSVAGVNAVFFGLVRSLRQTIQIGMLGLGAYLVLTGSMSAGLIFAASIIGGRALMPIEQMTGAWKSLENAYEGHRRIQALLASIGANSVPNAILPAPTGQISVSDVSYQPHPDIRPILSSITLEVRPGEILAILGPSGCGKSTLMRLMAGAIAPISGEIKLDGFKLGDWDPIQRGAAIGYVPQDIDLFPGTVFENIARFNPDADDAQVVKAAMRARAHELIATLPQGYQTLIGPEGTRISGGQRQRIALARAFFGDPKLLILDEPNAHLDTQGEENLNIALRKASELRMAVIVATQRQSILTVADRRMLLTNGRIEMDAPRQKVFVPKIVKAPAPSGNSLEQGA